MFKADVFSYNKCGTKEMSQDRSCAAAHDQKYS